MEEKILQLQEELGKVEQERCKALEDLEEIRWRMRAEEEKQAHSKNHIEILELELEQSRESERRMLESLVSQTKELDQTKIHHEEAKLEIIALNERIHAMESSKFAVIAAADASHGGDEVAVLRMELCQALAAEEKIKKAMNDLALSLKEVAMESSLVKDQLRQGRCDTEDARSEIGRLTSFLRRTEDKLRLATEESKRRKIEAEESSAAWQEMEAVFLNCIRTREAEAVSLKQENSRLVQAHRAAREEVTKLRDVMKQAIDEASVVKDALEIARRENSQFQDVLTEKDDLISVITQDLESVTASEATALDIIKELQSLLVAPSSLDVSQLSRNDRGSAAPTPRKKSMNEYPSENWQRGNRRQRSGRYMSLDSDSDDLEGWIFDSPPDSPRKTKMKMNRRPSLGAEDRKNSSRTMTLKRMRTKLQVTSGEEINAWESPSQIKMKKKQILRRFGEMLRRSLSSKIN